MQIIKRLTAFFGKPAQVSTKDGFVDLDLPITEAVNLQTGGFRVTARGRLRGNWISFAVEIGPTWIAKTIPNSDARFYWGKARLISVGPESDQFLKFVADSYGETNASGSMAKSIEAEAVGLANDPSAVGTDPTKMKFFFNSQSEQDYAEVFINVDVPSAVLQFHEKDPEYREPLLRALRDRDVSLR